MSVRNFSLFVLLIVMISCNSTTPESYTAFGDSHINKFDFAYYFPTYEIQNEGVNGLTIEEIEALIRLDLDKTKKLIVHAGTNDLIKALNKNITEDVFLQDIEIDILNFVSALTEYEQSYIIGSLPLTIEYINSPMPYNLNSVENIWKEQIGSIQNVHYISIEPLLNDEGFLDSNYSSDLIHLNTNGYSKLTSLIYEKLD